MKLKIKAFLATVGIVVVSILASLGIQLIGETFTTQEIVFGVQCLSMALLLYCVYSLILTRLEMEETLGKK